MVCVLLLTLCLHQHFLSFPSISCMFQFTFKIGAITCVIPSNCTSEYKSGPSFFYFVICGRCTDTHIIYPPTFGFLPFLLQFDFHLNRYLFMYHTLCYYRTVAHMCSSSCYFCFSILLLMVCMLSLVLYIHQHIISFHFYYDLIFI
jgi:hypothetical protein